ncbi:hypothetical protein EON66_08260 [archaeon]|nr:MAG: hypothetical protein EON66_08260 [archaeon]
MVPPGYRNQQEDVAGGLAAFLMSEAASPMQLHEHPTCCHTRSHPPLLHDPSRSRAAPLFHDPSRSHAGATCAKNSSSCAGCLLAAGADAELMDNEGLTPLYIAYAFDSEAARDARGEVDSDAEDADDNGTPMCEAYHRDQPEDEWCMRSMFDLGAHIHPTKRPDFGRNASTFAWF